MIRPVLVPIVCCLALAITAAGQTTMLTGQKAPENRPARMACAGKVVDTDDRPVAGAAVRAYQWDNDKNEPSIVGEMTTKDDGAFAFQWNAGDDPYRNGWVLARKDGLAIGWNNWADQRSEMADIVVRLGKRAVLEGVVTDEAGAPIAGAEVVPFLQRQSGNSIRYVGGHPLDWLTGRTDEKGRFRFDNIPDDAQAGLAVEARGRAVIRTLFARGEFTYAGQPDIRIVLPVEARLEGVVINKATSQPVAGVKLIASAESPEYNIFWRRIVSAQYPWNDIFWRRTVSGQDGRFSFESLLACPVSVQVQPPSTAASAEWVADPVSVATEAGKTAKVTVVVAKGGILEVLMTDKAATPVSGARASVSAGRTEPGATGATDQDGVARIRVKPGTYRFAGVYRRGYMPMSLQDGALAESVTVEEGQTVRLTIRLEPLPKIRGTVRDKEGRPVVGANVWLLTGLGDGVSSGPDGRFEITQDPQLGVTGIVAPAILARHVQRGLAAMIEVQDPERPVEIPMVPGATLTGKVTEADSKAVPNARVTAYVMIGNYAHSFCEAVPSKADAQGQYEIKAVPAGRYELQAEADGYGQARAKITIEEGRSDSIQTPLALPVANLSISGAVVDIEDKPVAGAAVFVYGQNQQNRQGKTDQAGKFVFEKVVGGDLQVQAYAVFEGKRRFGWVRRAKGGDRDVMIVLNQEADETGRIRPIAASLSRPLLGQPLLKLEEFGLKSAAAELAAGKRILVCFWDMEQRPSRRAILALAERAADLEKKGVIVVTVHASGTDEKQVREWMASNKVPFHAGMVPSEKDKAAKVLAAWGVGGVPWLVLTDEKHLVTSEGSPMERLLQELGLAASTRPATQPAGR